MSYSKWYIIRLFQQNKILFFFVCIFIFFQFYFNKKQIHSFPWYVWDMYSRIETKPDTITQTAFYVDGKQLDITSIPIWEESTLLHTFNMYYSIQSNNYKDPIETSVKKRTKYLTLNMQNYIAHQIQNSEAAVRDYPRWLIRYIEKITHKNIKQVDVRKMYYQYQNGKIKDLQRSELLLKINK